jgi:hypothetical protein
VCVEEKVRAKGRGHLIRVTNIMHPVATKILTPNTFAAVPLNVKAGLGLLFPVQVGQPVVGTFVTSLIVTVVPDEAKLIVVPETVI